MSKDRFMLPPASKATDPAEMEELTPPRIVVLPPKLASPVTLALFTKLIEPLVVEIAPESPPTLARIPPD